jgi:hypothetical protein
MHFTIEVRPRNEAVWSVSVKPWDLNIVGGVVQAGIAQLLCAVLLLAEEHGLIENDFDAGVPRDQVLHYVKHLLREPATQ